MKKLLLLLLFFLTSCARFTPEEIEARKQEDLKRAAAKIQRLHEMEHTCDKNEGIAKIEDVCGRGCYATNIICKDGMMRQFEGTL